MRAWNVPLTTLAGFALIAVAAAAPPQAPSPELSPADVVRIQVRALAHNDEPHENAGIELAYRFASPVNRSMNGPLARFIDIVHGPVYRALLNHREARYGPLSVEENGAQQPVLLTTAGGERVGFLFTLARQETGSCPYCWLTKSVVRFEVSQEEGRAWLMM